jgi:hypothetical protein
MAQINQTRDNLKTEYQSINIVQWKNSTDLKRLTSVERGGECVFWNSDLMKQIVMCKGLLDWQRHPENGYHFVDIIQWKIELIQLPQSNVEVIVLWETLEVNCDVQRIIESAETF